MKSTLKKGSKINVEAKKTDEIFGKTKEEEHLGLIRELFGPTLQKTDKWFMFDFSSEDCYVELKSRRCTHDKYPDTMIGINKLNYCHRTDKDVYFCFAFTDGLYYWKHNDVEYEAALEIRKGGRTDRGFDETKDYAYIKTSFLKKV